MAKSFQRCWFCILQRSLLSMYHSAAHCLKRERTLANSNECPAGSSVSWVMESAIVHVSPNFYENRSVGKTIDELPDNRFDLSWIAIWSKLLRGKLSKGTRGKASNVAALSFVACTLGHGHVTRPTCIEHLPNLCSEPKLPRKSQYLFQ